MIYLVTASFLTSCRGVKASPIARFPSIVLKSANQVPIARLLALGSQLFSNLSIRFGTIPDQTLTKTCAVIPQIDDGDNYGCRSKLTVTTQSDELIALRPSPSRVPSATITMMVARPKTWLLSAALPRRVPHFLSSQVLFHVFPWRG